VVASKGAEDATVPMDLSVFVERVYLTHHPAMRESSASMLRVAARRAERWRGMPWPVGDLTDTEVNAYLSDSYRGGLAPATINSYRRMLLTLWQYAWRQGYCRTAPKQVERFRELRHAPRAWTLSQVSDLVLAAKREPGEIADIPAGLWWSSLLTVGYYTAARPSAILAVEIMDLGPNAETITLRAETSKTWTDQTFSLPIQAQQAVLSIFTRSRKLAWPWPHHRQYWWRCLRRIVERACIPCGGRHCDLWYRLRRTAISYAALRSLEDARKLAGHTTSATTLAHYIDPLISPPIPADLLPALRI